MTALPDEAPDAVAQFLQLSVLVTGYDEYTLLGTGMVRPYYDELALIIGARELGSLLGAFSQIGRAHGQFRKRILESDRYGPVARNVMRLWYLGMWQQLPREWRNAYGATSYDTDHMVSAAAYRAGLVWPTAGAHPMGARQPGFGSWTEPPTLREPL